jgi:hypothetical protein
VNAVYGIRASRPPGARECYIADNVLQGITSWVADAMGANGKNIGEGIQVTGPGNVICFNRVTAFRDCISTMEDRGTSDQFCIDICVSAVPREGKSLEATLPVAAVPPQSFRLGCIAVTTTTPSGLLRRRLQETSASNGLQASKNCASARMKGTLSRST